MGIIAYVVLYALMLQKGYQESKVEKLGGSNRRSTLHAAISDNALSEGPSLYIVNSQI